MNRLWIRLSLAFTAVVLIVMIVIGVMTHLALQFDDTAANEVPPEVRAYFEQIERERPPFDMTIVLIVVGVVAIVAGVGMSKSLTAPLDELGQAAQAIGKQNLSQRVTVKGTAEIQAVAARFNEMAGELEIAETLRRNLLADVAHELRHPIHVLQGNLQAILDDVYPLNKEEIARLSDQTRHLKALVNDLHELSLAEAQQLPLNLQLTDMAQLVKETAVAFKPVAAAKNIKLQVELLGTIPSLNVDAARMRQVMHNLLNNALRHTGENGRITVIVEAKQKNLQIHVHDTGSGIAAEHLPYVFDRFYRTDSARSRDAGGTGLGLAIVRAIVEVHHGQVTAASPGVGQGSVITFNLPPTRKA